MKVNVKMIRSKMTCKAKHGATVSAQLKDWGLSYYEYEVTDFLERNNLAKINNRVLVFTDKGILHLNKGK